MSSRSAFFERLVAPHRKELVAVWSREAERFLRPDTDAAASTGASCAAPGIAPVPAPVLTSGAAPAVLPCADPFTDPATHRVQAAAEAFADLLLRSPSDADNDPRLTVMEECIRLVALREKTAEESLALFFRMKDSIRTMLAAAFRGAEGLRPAYTESEGLQPAYMESEGRQPAYMESEGRQPAYTESEGRQPAYTELEARAELEARFDALIVPLFGMYARCRETLHRLRREETERRHAGLLRLLQKHYPGGME